jgi:hypothetical protein
MEAALRDLVRLIIESEVVSTMDTPVEALAAYVSDSRTITHQQRDQVARFVASHRLNRIRLERIESEDPDWEVEFVVRWGPKSFTQARVSEGERTGHVGWKSSDRALCCIEGAVRGWAVDYDLFRTQFNARAEREVIVSGSYRVVEKRKVTEPFTNPDYGYRIPMYVLVEA